MTEFIPISRMFFMPFSDGLIDFLILFSFFSCIFLSSAGKKSSVVLSSGSSVSEIFSLHRDIFLSSAEKFFHLIPVFSVLFLNSFRRKSLFFSASASCFRAFFPHLSNHFQAFSRAVWKIFLSVSIIFPLFLGLSGEKIHISRNGFSVWLLSSERNFSTIPVFWGSRSILFCRSCAGSCRVFPPSSRFSSGIFCILRMPLAVFFPAIPVLFPLFLPFPLMENLLLSCFCTDFLHGTDAHAFARA